MEEYSQMGPTSSRLKSTWNTLPPPPPTHSHHKATSFYWGYHNVQFLFPGWPNNSKSMYSLALIFVFSLAMMVEWLNHLSPIKPGSNKVAAWFFRTGMNAVRSGLAYMVILAVMSYNGGVFLAAVAGHAIGSLVFGCWALRKSGSGSPRPRYS